MLYVWKLAHANSHMWFWELVDIFDMAQYLRKTFSALQACLASAFVLVQEHDLAFCHWLPPHCHLRHLFHVTLFTRSIFDVCRIHLPLSFHIPLVVVVVVLSIENLDNRPMCFEKYINFNNKHFYSRLIYSLFDLFVFANDLKRSFSMRKMLSSSCNKETIVTKF